MDERVPRILMNISLGERCRQRVKCHAFFMHSLFVLFCLALLVSACCKIWALDSRELWLDETYSAFVANLPFGELFRRTAGDVHPPLYNILLWVWIRIVGEGQAHLRLFSVVLNICSTLGMFVLGRRLLGDRYGAFATVLFAFSPMLFVYSLEVRMYMLLILVFIGLLIVHWRMAVEQNNAKWLVVAYSILAALLFYVHYIGIYILLGLFVHWMITSVSMRVRMHKLFAAGILTILFVSPGIPVLLVQHSEKTQLNLALKLSYRDPGALSYSDTAQDSIKSAGGKVLAKSAAAMAGFYPAATPLLLLLCAFPLAIALAGAGYLALIRGDELCRLFGVVTLAVGIGVIALQLFATRYLLSLVPLLVLAVARAVQYGSTKFRWRVTSLTAGTLILCLYAAGFYRQAFIPHGRPWQNLVSFVQQNYSPGDTVLFDALYAQVPFDYFARQAHFQPQETGFPLSIYDWWDRQGFKGWGGPVILQSDLDQFLAALSASRSKTLWLVLYETYYYDPHDALLGRLSQLGQVTEVCLPPDRDAASSQEALRLIRITIR